MSEHASLTTSTREFSRVAQNATLVDIAERELGQAVVEQVRPPMGMYVRSSSEESAAMQRAVRVICTEAHHLDLRAEEMLVDIKQAWTQLAPVRARHLADRDGDVLREVVSSAIEVFFEARDLRNRAVHSIRNG